MVLDLDQRWRDANITTFVLNLFFNLQLKYIYTGAAQKLHLFYTFKEITLSKTFQRIQIKMQETLYGFVVSVTSNII